MRATVRTEGLNCHSTPAGPVVDQFKRGDRLNIFGEPKHYATVAWYPAELMGEQRISAGRVDGRFLNFEHDDVKPMPAPPCDFPLPTHDWDEDDGPKPASLLRTSQVTFWCVFAVIAVGSLFMLTWPWWR